MAYELFKKHLQVMQLWSEIISHKNVELLIFFVKSETIATLGVVSCMEAIT